jgi:hypothetical protein
MSMTKRIALLILIGIFCSCSIGVWASEDIQEVANRQARLAKADGLYEESAILKRTFERELRAILRQSRRAVRDELAAIYAVLRIDSIGPVQRGYRECVAPQGVCDKGSCCVEQR